MLAVQAPAPPRAEGRSRRNPRRPAQSKIARLGDRARRFWLGRGILTRVAPRVSRWARSLAWGYLALVVAFTAGLWLLGDRWWPVTALLFGPRWLILVPAPFVAAGALLVRPATLLPLTVSLGIAIGPGMGFRTGWRDWVESDHRDLRVITFNIDAGENFRAFAIPQDLERFAPDVMVFQECDEHLADPQYWPEGWTIRFDAGLCLGSRYPLLGSTQEEEVHTGDLGGTGTARLYRLDAPGGPVDLVSVHLETPRKGLQALEYGGNASRMGPSTFVRDVGSRRIRRWVARQSQAAIVAGDFNMPVESVIYQRYWSDCPNAFSAVGHGFGYTRILKGFSIRIDHVLDCGGWRPVKALVGPDLGSDHRPLIVDLRRNR